MSHPDWRSAYDKQMDLWSWWHTAGATRMAEGYMRSVYKTGHGQPLGADRLVEGQREIMLRADPVVIDDDMMTLVETAAQSFPPEPLREEDILTPVAFVWLPRPLSVIDAGGKRLTFRAVAWGPVRYRVTDDSGARITNGLMLSYYSWLGDAAVDDYADHMAEFAEAYNIDLSMSHWEPWMFGESYTIRPDVPGAGREGLRFVQTMWRLMQQTIATLHPERPQRAARRRAQRAGMADKTVTVIRLRRPKKEPADGHQPKSVDWDHRWMVSGHWRNQWFRSLGPATDPAAHRAIWIHPYIKGPEDRPLEVRRIRAFEWVQ